MSGFGRRFGPWGVIWMGFQAGWGGWCRGMLIRNGTFGTSLFGLLQGEEKVRPGPSKEGRRLAFLVMENRRLGARFGGPGGVSYGGCLPRGKWCIVFTGGYPVAKNRFPRGEWWSEIKPEQMIGKGSYLTGGVGVSWCIDFKLGFWRGVQLTGVCILF